MKIAMYAIAYNSIQNLKYLLKEVLGFSHVDFTASLRQEVMYILSLLSKSSYTPWSPFLMRVNQKLMMTWFMWSYLDP